MNIEIQKINNNLHDIFLDDTKVGWIIFTKKNNSIIIDSINIFSIYRKYGIGSSVIKKLLENNESIHGCSSPFAIGFWRKLGAIFDYNINEDDISYLLNIGEFPSFSLKK